MRKIIGLPTICLILLWATSAQALGVQKLGYVNADRVYSESQTAKRIEANLQQEFSKQRHYLETLSQQGLQLKQRLEKGQLKPNEKTALENQLIEAVSKHRLAVASFTEEYNLRRNEEFAALQNNANAIINQIAERENFDLIVQEAVFVRPEYDITERVIKSLDGN